MTVPINDDWKSEATDALFDAILALETREEAEAFFRDLCTRRELNDLSHRWEIVLLLAAGFSYREIAARSGGSTATITRINEWLQHGRGGYGLILDRLDLIPEEHS